jgi:LacI family transcriptional regulator
MATTLGDIARKAGISVSTVSRVLNKKTAHSRISRDTERLVLKTAKELDYRPNQLARGLRLKRTHTLGLVVPDIANPFFACIIKSIQVVSHSQGYSLVVCDTNETLDLEVEHSSLLVSKGVDGLIVFPVGQKASHLKTILASGVPLVVADRCFTELPVNSVSVDNYQGAFEAVEHLIARGHFRIAIILGLAETLTTRERLRGYCDALCKNGCTPDELLMVGNDYSERTGYVTTKMLLSMKSPPTAIFTTSDVITLGALKAIAEEGVSVPGDISLVAFDDLEGVEYFRCPITAVAQPKERIGEIAVKLLVEHMKSRVTGEPRNIVVKPKLIIRDSVSDLSRRKPEGRHQ